MNKKNKPAKSRKMTAAELAEIIKSSGLSRAEITHALDLHDRKISEIELEQCVRPTYPTGKNKVPHQSCYKFVGQPRKAELYPESGE